MMTIDRQRICLPEYIRNFLPEVWTGTPNNLNRPSFFNSMLKKTSSPINSSSSNPPAASKFLRVVKRKAPAPSARMPG